MGKYEVERGLISKLIETGDILTIKDSQITAKFFMGEHARVFNFIYDTVLNSGQVPSARVVEQHFPNYELYSYFREEGDFEADFEIVGTEENLKFWCNELRLKTKHNTLAGSMEDIVELLQNSDTEEAYAKLKKTIAFIESEVTETADVDITKNVEDRKQAYLKRKENKGMEGLAYPLDFLNYLTKGLKPETLTTLIALSGTGKTWFEILIGSYLMLQNCTVLQFVTEMSETIMRDRYEAMLYSMCYGEMSYSNFKSGVLPLEQEKKFFEFLENDLPNFEPLIIATATGVMGMSAEIEKYNPDIVLVDGVYLMEDDQGAKDDWLRVAHITRDIKKLAKRTKKPIFINTQADKNTSKKTGPELNSIMYTQAIGQDSDEVMALLRDEIMIADHEAQIKMLKQREGILGKVTMNWDFDHMDFSQIYGDGDKEQSSDNEEISNNVIGIDAMED